MSSLKYKYTKPEVVLLSVELDEGIAAGSATIFTGWESINEENVPKSTDWENSWNSSRDFDF